MIYLDNAATTPVCPEAAAVMAEMLTNNFGNPSSTHAAGRKAAAALNAARGAVAAAVGAQSGEIVFTSGGTEADNWAVFCGCEKQRHKAKHIIVSAYEHDAILQPAARLESQGWEVTRLSPDKTGHITPEAVLSALRKDTALVSVMLVNNEIGAVNPIADIADIVHKNSGALMHTDAVQGLFKVPVSVKKLGIDLMSLSGHKIHGPKGSGALYIRNGLRLPTFIYGGGQENALRSGTEAMPAVAGFGEAARIGKQRSAEGICRMQTVRQKMTELLAAQVPQAVILGPGEAPHILSLSMPGYKSEVLLNMLDSEGIYISKGSACKKGRRSHVLEVMGYEPKIIDGALRISLSRYNTEDEAEAFVSALRKASERVLKVL